ncbi:MAG: M28 family peptidase [Gemmatimonadaceae bacterium]|nr:M28 family peptidase [Gemmatimonadaceae bacterium]
MSMSRLRILPLGGLVWLAGCVSAGSAVRPSAGELPRTHVPAATESAITPADLMTRLYIIADDSMLGREAGTVGNVKATNYIAREMERMGLRPGGENGTYFQTVPVIIARIDSTRAIAVDGTTLQLGTEVLPFYASLASRLLPIAASTRSLEGVQAVYGGQLGGTLIDPSAAAGKLVVFGVPAGSNGRRDWRFFTQGSLSRYAGAAGIAAPVLDVVPANTLPRIRGPQVRPRDENVTGVGPVTLLVTPAAAARMLGVASLEGLAVGATGRTITGTTGFIETPAPYPSRNVIGILPGSDPTLRGQYVAIGAHNDHIGLTRRPLDHDSVLANNMVVRRQGVQDTVRVPTAAEAARIAVLRDSLVRAHGGARPDSVNNGADDDGSGTVALLEIAQRFASASAPKRSMLFVSHTGEEKGLWGSEWFTDHPTVPRDSVVAQLNMDMVGRGKATDIMGRGPNNVQLIGPRRLSTQLGDLIDSVNAARTPHMDIDPSFDANGHPLNRYCRSDHYMYARYGIPITYFSLGYHTDYHQVTDEPQYIDYEHMARIARFVSDIGQAIADRPQRLVVDKPRPDPAGGCRQ